MAIVLTQNTRTKAEAMFEAATHIAQLIIHDEPIARATLNSAMTNSMGQSDANGLWNQKDSFIMLEIANVLALKAQAGKGQGDLDKDEIMRLTALGQQQPTHTVRSEDQIQYQQFSTPLPLARLLWEAACAQPGDTILEPSAGTGKIATFPARENFNLTLNEIDPLRIELLKMLFPTAQISNHDAAEINAFMTSKFDIILMNPPFARDQGRYDKNTALRHLISACHCLNDGGRLVAIMPPNFIETSDEIAAFNKLVRNIKIRSLGTFENSFAKHGTGITTKMVVIDHLQEPLDYRDIETDSIEAILQTIGIPREQRKPQPPKAITAPKTPLFAGFKTKIKTEFTKRPSGHIEIAPVAYAKKEIGEKLEPVGQYLPYRPSVITITGAVPHPTKLVESIAMGSIQAPIPSYEPRIPTHLISEGVVSESQLETLIYAGEAHETYLPGKFVTDPKHLILKEDAQGKAYKTGFFLGDGTGAGKGRQIALIILDQWLRDRRKHIWITENAPLLEDARRDWSALGNVPLDIQPLSNWSPGEKITMSDGILFATYATMRNSTGDGSRLQQILDWAGSEFDGVTVFDEAHAMGGVAGGETGFGEKKGSLQGLTGVRLQHALPEARVVYSSATGASDINNIAYATRLGLWGTGTAFPTRDNFISDIRDNGIAAMEVVARELKGQGRYIARSLSYEGIEYDILEQKLDEYQIRDFNLYADAWGIIHRNMEEAMKISNIKCGATGATLNGRALGVARSRFESCKQRFFNQTLLTMKLPAVIPAMEEALANDQSVVVQLVTTAEAMLDRRLGNLDPTERANLELTLSPLEYLTDYLHNAFPTTQMRVFAGEDGRLRSEPVMDGNGSPVECQTAVNMRDELLETIFGLPQMPSALDGIIHHFGTEKVAEVTGRSRRLVVDANGRQRVESRSARSNVSETMAFMHGNKRVLVFSDAGGTGRSYHASLDSPNQQRRVHFLLEPGWRADKAIQGLGRTNRTHQASAPIFRPVTTDCRGERRFISTIARRLDTLGALTKGQRQTGGQNLFNPADNLESEYAKDALTSWCNLLIKSKLKSTNRYDFEHQTGLELINADTGDSSFPSIQKWLNRILALRIETQNAIFDEFTGLVEERIEAARKAGTLDMGLESFPVEKLTIIDRKILRTDERTMATTDLVTAEIQYRNRITSLADVLDRAKTYGKHANYLYNNRSKNPALLTPSKGYLDFEGNFIPMYRITRPTNRSVISHKEMTESDWHPISREEFIRRWSEKCEYEETHPTTEIMHIVTGQLLPIWNKISSEYSSVRRIITPDGGNMLGRIIDPSQVSSLCTEFKIEQAVNLSNEQIANILQNGQSYPVTPNQRFAHTLQRRYVNGHHRIEIREYDAHRLSFYKSLGCFTEIIASKTRLFVPELIVPAIIDTLTKT